MKIIFDTEGVSMDCPVADMGLTTLPECQDCEHILEMDGANVICTRGEPIGNEILQVEEIEIDLETLANAVFYSNRITRDRARMKVISRILKALTPEDRGKLHQYQEAACSVE